MIGVSRGLSVRGQYPYPPRPADAGARLSRTLNWGAYAPRNTVQDSNLQRKPFGAKPYWHTQWYSGCFQAAAGLYNISRIGT